MVLAILVVVTAIAMPRMAGAEARYRAQAAAERLAADLQMASRYAEATGTSKSVQFDLEGSAYTLNGVAFGKAANTSVSLGQPPYRAVIARAALPASGIVKFDSSGAAESGVAVSIVVGREVRTVRLSRASRVVTVDRVAVVSVAEIDAGASVATLTTTAAARKGGAANEALEPATVTEGAAVVEVVK